MKKLLLFLLLAAMPIFAQITQPGGSGSGSVSGTTGYIPKYSGSTAVGNSSCDEGITSANILTCTIPIVVAGDGVHAAALGLVGNTTVPSLTSNNFHWIGPNSASFTAWGIQMASAENASAGILHVGAASSHISQGTVSALVEGDLSLTDITTANVSTTKHGFAPKLPNDATKYLDGTGSYSVPSGGGGVAPLWVPFAGQFTPGTGSSSVVIGGVAFPASGAPSFGGGSITGFAYQALTFAHGATNTLYYATVIPAGVSTTPTLSVDLSTISLGANGNVRWSTSAVCVADGSTTDSPTYNTAVNVTKTVGAINVWNNVAFSSLTMTGCAAGKLLQLRVQRLGADGADTDTDASQAIGMLLKWG